MMKNEIKVPSLGESISEATIGQILAPEGTVVKADGEILELETDKVTQVLYAPSDGKIHLNVKTGETVKIGQTIGSIEASGEKETKGQTEPLTQSDRLGSVEPVIGEEAAKDAAKDPKGASVRYTRDAFLADLKQSEPPRSAGIEPSQAKQQAQPKQQAAGAPLQRETRRPMSQIRKVIAKRLVEAQQTMAMLTTFNEIDMMRIMQLREKYQEPFLKKYGCKLGLMPFFVKAAVSALLAFPDVNSYIDGDAIVHREYFDIGVAVGTEKGVIVPVVRKCDELNFREIEQAIENFAKKARTGELTAPDLQGGGFTLTNGGVYGSLLSTPLLLPPQCAILGLHKIEKRPVVIDDQIAIRSMMYAALSYDHRLIDGKEAVAFLVHIKNILEEPSRLLLEI